MKIRAVQPQMVDFSEISEHLNSCVRKYLHMYICLLYLHIYTHGCAYIHTYTTHTHTVCYSPNGYKQLFI